MSVDIPQAWAQPILERGASASEANSPTRQGDRVYDFLASESQSLPQSAHTHFESPTES